MGGKRINNFNGRVVRVDRNGRVGRNGRNGRTRHNGNRDHRRAGNGEKRLKFLICVKENSNFI
jgi:hypothetical protein